MLSLGQEIPGEITKQISKACDENQVWASIGLLEQEGGKLFDTVVVTKPTGEIVMKYRRLSPGWHWPKSDPAVFCEGNEVFSVETPFGKLACLICGDFFDDQKQFEQIFELQPDILHLAIVRADGKGLEYSQEEWESKELPEYASRVKEIGIPVFMVNYIQGDCFGGATIFDSNGSVLSSCPIWQESILKYELIV